MKAGFVSLDCSYGPSSLHTLVEWFVSSALVYSTDSQMEVFNNHSDQVSLQLCVCEGRDTLDEGGERETERERQREKERESERETEGESEREREKEKERERESARACVCVCV